MNSSSIKTNSSFSSLFSFSFLENFFLSFLSWKFPFNLKNYFFNSFKKLISFSFFSSSSLLIGHPIGLENLGNTCFLNALLQALASLPSILQYLQQITTIQTHSQTQKNKLNFTKMLLKCIQGSFLSSSFSLSSSSSSFTSSSSSNINRFKIQRWLLFNNEC